MKNIKPPRADEDNLHQQPAAVATATEAAQIRQSASNLALSICLVGLVYNRKSGFLISRYVHGFARVVGEFCLELQLGVDQLHISISLRVPSPALMKGTS
ncbi:hypothetical protein LZ554_008003 [Drepanopeziza brunnea f. sp. 'monogermtubi']|nr:hypothetical protein LZ554_008003 [Drepanopeziza brunnea f. sp. 'monogermtubi']